MIVDQWIERGLREFKASMEDDSLRGESLKRESSIRESLKREPRRAPERNRPGTLAVVRSKLRESQEFREQLAIRVHQKSGDKGVLYQ